MKTLEQILEDYSVESYDKFCEDEFIDVIETQMPGYDITVWNMDEPYFGPSVADTITATVEGKFVEDIQSMSWRTNNQDCYMFAVAIKVKEQK